MSERKTSKNSDPIMGEWYGSIARLEAMGRPYIILREARDPRPTPGKLHIHKSEGHLGGLFFTTAMKRYLRQPNDKPPSQSAQERRWFIGESAEREMRAMAPADIVDIILAVRRDGQTWDAALLGSNRAIKEVKVAMRHLARHFKGQIREQFDNAA